MKTNLEPNQHSTYPTSPSSFAMAVRNGLEDCNDVVKRLNVNDPSTSSRKLVRFCPATPDFMRQCIQQASISTRINLATFARG